MIDEDKAIKIALKTGKIFLGNKNSMQAIRQKKAKLIIKAANCPEGLSKELQHYCKIAEIKLHTYKGSSRDLGEICGRYHLVSTLAVIDPGDSQDILRLS
ncbi:MAG: 50S ribosomal protein L30e [Candidatus Helarchaeota archaeon]